MKGLRILLSIVVSVVALFLAPAGVSGDSTLSIQVSFQIDHADLQRIWSDQEQAETSAAMRAELRTRLATLFPHWRFVEADTLSAMVEAKASVRRFVPDQAHLELKFLTGGAERDSWDAVWLGPGDVPQRGWPSPSRARNELAPLFEQDLFKERAAEISSRLREDVPLALGGEWDSTAVSPTVITPLPWEEHEGLASSEFLVICGKPEEDRLSLVGRADRFPAVIDTFKALIVMPESHSELGARELKEIHEAMFPLLLQTELLAIYLLREIKHDTVDIFVRGGP